ncbi:MAG: biotin--[acetyl-CoA-carboxylase] ligase [Bacteroidetes bacterium]|nr:biotin--[acetyl-CoA-carboxylase] ligase [Bacteroidota bacterium]
MPISFEIIEYESVDSTNNELKKLANQSLAYDGLCIWTPNQTLGRGQRNNIWETKANQNLTFSFYASPKYIIPQESFLLVRAISIGVMLYLESHISNHDVSIKWPNDLIIGHKKVAGILIENTFSGHELKSIIGIGINLNQLSFNSENAGSLTFFSGEQYTIRAELNHCLFYISKALKTLKTNRTAIEKMYDSGLFKKNELCEFEAHNQKLMGQIVGTDEFGRLQVETNGSVHHYLNGEIKMIY